MDSPLFTQAHIHASLQSTMKKLVDTHRWDVSYSTGDWVFVHLRPYRQVSVRPSYTKLSKRFYGPFLILERIGPMAYQLQLLASSKIHPIFHVSLLKPYHGNPPSTFGQPSSGRTTLNIGLEDRYIQYPSHLKGLSVMARAGSRRHHLGGLGFPTWHLQPWGQGWSARGRCW